MAVLIIEKPYIQGVCVPKYLRSRYAVGLLNNSSRLLVNHKSTLLFIFFKESCIAYFVRIFLRKMVQNIFSQLFCAIRLSTVQEYGVYCTVQPVFLHSTAILRSYLSTAWYIHTIQVGSKLTCIQTSVFALSCASCKYRCLNTG